MRRNTKFLGPALVIAAVIGALVASSPSHGEGGGHFVFGSVHTNLKGSEEGSDTTLLGLLNGGTTIECTEVKYEGTVKSETKTTTQVTLTPTYPKCWVNGLNHANPTNATVNMNGCDYIFTVRKFEPEKFDNTVTFHCPSLPAVVETELCVFTFGGQTPGNGGVVYTTTGAGNIHGITGDVTVGGLAYKVEGPLCGGVPERKDGFLEGAAIVIGSDTDKNPVGITATGT